MQIQRLTTTIALIATMSLAGLPRAMAMAVDDDGWHAHSHSHGGQSHVHWHRHAPVAPDDRSSEFPLAVDAGDHHDANKHIGAGDLRIASARQRVSDSREAGEAIPSPACGWPLSWPPPSLTYRVKPPPQTGPAFACALLKTVVLVI